jgi:hypothetical protein
MMEEERASDVPHSQGGGTDVKIREDFFTEGFQQGGDALLAMCVCPGNYSDPSKANLAAARSHHASLTP